MKSIPAPGGTDEKALGVGRPVSLILTMVVCSVLANSCAKIIAPPGGPEDKTQPTILSASPENNSVGIAEGNRFEVYFSEAINSRGVEKQIFISPRPISKPEIKLKGERLSVIFAQPFAPDQTYVITLGPAIADLRGNRLGESKSFAFTRGEKIDTNSIAGMVTDDDAPARGIGVALYRSFIPQKLGDLDSLFPDYYTLSGDDGSFRLEYLPPDDYFLLAFDDKDKSQLFSYGVERFGVTTKKVDLADSSNQNLELRLQTVDTSQVSILGVTTTADRLVRASLMGKIDAAILTDNLEHIRLVSTSDSADVYIPAGLRNMDSERRSKFEFYFLGLTEGEYELVIDFPSFYDDGREETARTFSPFVYKVEADEQAPSLAFPPTSSPLTAWDKIEWTVSFSEPVGFDSVVGARGLSVQYAGGIEIDFALIKKDPFTYLVRANIQPLAGAEYRLTIPSEAVTDLAGNHLTDSISVAELSVWPEDSLGSLTLSVENLAHPTYDGSYNLLFDRLQGGEFSWFGAVQDSLALNLPSGNYILQVNEDSDTLSFRERFDGSLYPLRYAEPRSFYPDTISVRPRFETSGITVIIE